MGQYNELRRSNQTLRLFTHVLIKKSIRCGAHYHTPRCDTAVQTLKEIRCGTLHKFFLKISLVTGDENITQVMTNKLPMDRDNFYLAALMIVMSQSRETETVEMCFHGLFRYPRDKKELESS